MKQEITLKNISTPIARNTT